MKGRSQFIPILNSEAGLCLTGANWEEVGVETASCMLESLLLKPGLAFLQQIPDLKAYLGWSGALVLNASNFTLNKKGVYSLTSPFDGSKVVLTPQALIELLAHLKPDAVLLPQHILKEYPEFWTHWERAVLPYIHVKALDNQGLEQPHGAYFTGFDLEEVALWSPIPRVISGELKLDELKQLRALGVDLVESDTPAHLAMQGQVYSTSDLIDLKDKAFEMQFEVIDPQCSCPTCSQGLTRAYLHHLLLNTPLLCQRFLIQHNVSFITCEKSSFSS